MKEVEECQQWRKIYRRQELTEKSQEKAKKEYLESICDQITEYQKTGRYDLMYMLTKELGWTDKQGIQNTGIEDSQGNIKVDQRCTQIWENYITVLYNWANWPENIEVETEKEVDEDKKGPYVFCKVKLKSYQGDEGQDGYWGRRSICICTHTVVRRWSQNNDTTDQQDIWN